MATFVQKNDGIQLTSAIAASSSRLKICLNYKGAILLLLMNIVVGFTYGCTTNGSTSIILNAQLKAFPILVNFVLGGYCLLGLTQMLYPIGGLIADVRYGRYKVIKMSIMYQFVGAILIIIAGILYIANVYEQSDAIETATTVALVSSILIFLIGLGGFQSNVVQFGLDQLPDASSEELSLFLHWFVWTEYVGEMASHLLLTSSSCSKRLQNNIAYVIFPFVFLVTVCLIMVYCKRHWFNCENIVANPYRRVYEVLKFTAQHIKPLGHRSALTYSGDQNPSRIDFAKEKYGGIFTTEVVEDVKTILRILLMLLAITPMFYFEVSTSYLFPIYGLHLGKNVSVDDKCTYEWIVFESGNLIYIISVAAIPLYIILVYPHIKRWVPRIIYRMGIGVVLKVTAVITMFIIQVVANSTASHEYKCLFLAEYRNYKCQNFTQTLEFPTQALTVINLINGIASPLISITVLEFISAQSPHTMKGLLLGVFYAFKGLFITLACVATFPFAQEKLWGDHRGIFDCGFSYYLSNSVLGVIGLVVFLMAARRYRNRERDDPPYSHQYAEDYYSRYASRPTTRLVEEEVETYGSISQR